MALPKWLIPAGLMTLVVGGLAWMRKPSPEANDIVAFHAGHLSSGGLALGNIVGLAPNAKVAFKVASIKDDKLTGSVVGIVDPDTKALVVANIPIGVPLDPIDRSWVTDIFRGPVGHEKRV